MFTVTMGITTTEPKSQAQFLSPDRFRNIDTVRIALTVKSGETSNLPPHHPLHPIPPRGFCCQAFTRSIRPPRHRLAAVAGSMSSALQFLDCLSSLFFPLFFPSPGACTSVRWFEQCATLSSPYAPTTTPCLCGPRDTNQAARRP